MLVLFKGIFCAWRAWNADIVDRYPNTGKLRWQRLYGELKGTQRQVME